MDHTNVVLRGDASLDVSYLVQPFGVMQQPQQMMAQMALQHPNGGAPGAAIAPMLQNGQPDLATVEVEEDGKKKRKKRAYKPRDPNAPKRPLTAYFRYLGEMRPRIQQEMAANPDQFAASGKPGDIAKVATDRWNALTQDQQAPYKAAYQSELKNYEIAIAAYKAAGGAVDESTVDTPAVAAAAGAEKPVVPAVAAVAEKEDSDDSDDSTDDEEEAAAPPPPPPATTPKKSAMKKGRQTAQPASATIPTPVFNTVNDTAASAQLQEEAKSSSPSKKRKAAESTETDASKKKRGRKSKADEVVAAPDPAPAAPPASSPPTESSSGKKPKKDKKKKKSGD